MRIDETQVRQQFATMKNNQDLTEIRILTTKPDGSDGPAYSGIFEDPDTLVTALKSFETDPGIKYMGCYFTLNTLAPHCRSFQQYGRILRGVPTVTKKDILQLDWMLCDFDPKRKSKTSSTDLEKSYAHDVMRQAYKICWDAPDKPHFPRPALVCDSGNGHHLLWRLSAMENTTENENAIKDFLQAVHDRFETEFVEIDTTVFKVNQIDKLYGTMACKGEDTPERPHRMSSFYESPGYDGEAVTVEQLKAITRHLSPNKGKTSTPAPEPVKTAETSDKSHLLQRVENCLDQLDAKGVRFPANRDLWIKITAGMYHSLGPEGLPLYLRFSAMWERNNPREDEEKYKEMARYPHDNERTPPATIKAFFDICREKGATVPTDEVNEQFDLEALELDYSQPCPPPPVLVTVSGVSVAYDEGITVIAGKKKAAKSTTVCIICGSFLSGKEILNFHVDRDRVERMVLFDTEQPTFRLHRQVARSFYLAGEACVKRSDFKVIPLRPDAPAERRKKVTSIIRYYRPTIAVIDGVTDLVKNPNDPEESEAVVSELLALTTECHCALLCVIHTNTNDPTNKQRGHIGSSLERKQEACIFLEKDDDTGIFRVSAKDTRDKPFAPFHFMRDDNGDPQLINVADKPVTATDKLLAMMEVGQDYSRAELIEMLTAEGVTENTASQAVKRDLKKGYIIKSQDGTYHLPNSKP